MFFDPPETGTASRLDPLAELLGANCYRIVTGTLPVRPLSSELFRRKSLRCIVPKVGLEPTPPCGDRILRPAFSQGRRMAIALQSLKTKAITTQMHTITL